MIFQKGDKIQNYTVASLLKQGTYAECYRVKDVCGKNRFLKLIDHNRVHRLQISEDGVLLEAEIVKGLKHNNLCKFVDSGKIILNGGMLSYIVMEYVSGETLSQKIVRDEAIGVYEIKQMAKSVLSALDCLHSQTIPIIHNEVTMQNVFLNLVDGLQGLKLIDFGHACYLNQQCGKPDLNELNAFYLAPERFAGVCSVQSDLYSVGVMMYHLLYRKLPWFVDVSHIGNNDKVETILAFREKEIDTPDIEMFELDEQFVNVISKAISQDVECRFQTAQEFIDAIDGVVKIDRQSPQKKILSNNATSDKKVKSGRKRGSGFEAVAGMEKLKSQLRKEVIEPLNNPEEYHRYGVTIPNGMLLYGPPGCGKTFFAKHFAEEVGFNFMCITPAALKSRYVNATQENIAKMFEEAEKNAPTIIFIDEINELVPNRDGNDVHEMSRSAVNEMLAQMDRTGERGIFIIGATNYPHMIDPAIMRAGRLDNKYYIGVPDLDARKALFELYLKDRPFDFGLNYDELARMTENYVSADIQLIVNNASREALLLRGKITMDLLKQAISVCRPSLSLEELMKYEAVRAKMEGDKPFVDSKERRKIGF